MIMKNTVSLQTLDSKLAHLASLILFLLLSLVSASAQDLDDFEAASRYSKGVELIPYPDHNREANAIAQEKNRAFNEAKKYKYDTYKRQKENLLSEKKAKNKKIEEVIEDGEELKKRSDSAMDNPFERDINELKDDIEEIDDKLSDLNEDIEKAVDAWKRLYNARGGLRDKFDEVLEELDDTKDDPEDVLGRDPSDDDVKELKGYIDRITSNIKREVGEHKKQEDGAKGRAEDFEALLKLK